MARTKRVEIPITATDQATRTIKRVQGSLRGLAGTASSVMGGLTGFRSLAGVAGLTMLARTAINTGSRLDDVSKKLGIGTDFLQEFGFAAREVGVDTSAAEMGLQRFVRRVGEAQQGMGELLPTLKQYGIELKNSDGTMRSAEDILRDYANAISNVQNPQERLRMAFKAFDSEGAALVTVLAQGASGLDEFANKARMLGQIMDTETVKSLARAENAIEQFQIRFVNIFGNVLADAMEAYEAMKRNNFGDIIADGMAKANRRADLNPVIDQIEAAQNAFKELSDVFYGEGTIKLRELSDETRLFLKINDDIKQNIFSGGDTQQTLHDYILLINNLSDQLVELYSKLPQGELINLGTIGGEGAQQMTKEQIALMAERAKLLGLEQEYKQHLQSLIPMYTEAAESEMERNGVTQEYINLLKIAIGFQEEFDGVIKKTADNTIDNFDLMGNASRAFATGLENGLANAAANGKAAFGDMAQFVLAEIQRILIRMLLFRTFMGLGFTGFAQNFAPPPIPAGGARSAGGPVQAGRRYMVGERGPEMITMGANGYVTPSNQLGGPTFNIDMRGASLEAVQRLEQIVAAMNGSIEQRSVRAVQDAFSRQPSYMRR